MLLRKQHLASQSGVVFIKWHYSALYAAEKGAWKFPAAAGDTVRTGWTHPMGRGAVMESDFGSGGWVRRLGR